MNQMLTTAIEAATKAGDFIQLGAGRLDSLTIEQKSLNDFVSEIDRGAEEIIRQCIDRSFPNHTILGEEYGTSDQPDTDYIWIVDPLDGTTNFLRGIAHYAVSIAVTCRGELEVAVVYDPAKKEMYTALKGHGARLNGVAIECSNRQGVPGSLLATGIPFSGELLQEVHLFTDAMVNLLTQQTSGIRRLGAAALDLAYVAAGRYDGFWEAKLNQWDIAAGALLVQEAGGKVGAFHAGQNYLESGNIIACAQGVYAPMSQLVGEAYRAWAVS